MTTNGSVRSIIVI